jgi:hypothetical protein
MTGPIFPIQNFVVTPYVGSLTGINVSLLTRSGAQNNTGQTISAGHQSKAITTTMDWINTYPGQGVSINLQSQNNASQILDVLLMVYVDNELNSQDVTIYFPDTQQFVGVPAFTTGYYPVITGGQICNVYNGTTGKVPITAQSITSVIFCNFAVPGFLSQETLNVTFESSTGPRVPVIADTPLSGQYAIAGSPVLAILAPLTLPEQYVLGSITLTGAGLFVDSTSPGNFMEIQLVDVSTNKVIRQFNYYLAPSTLPGALQFAPICQLSGLNIPVQSLSISAVFPGSQPIPSTATAGFITFEIDFATVSL